MRKQVVDHVVHAEVREAERAVVVVQLERADARSIGLERQHKQVAHQAHMLDDVLRVAVLRARDIRLGQCWPPALQFTSFAGTLNSLFNLPDGIQIFVELLLVESADVAAQIPRIGQHRVEHTMVASLRLVFKHLVECQRGIDLEWRRRGRTAPRDVRTIEHRVILMHRRVRLFTAQHEARQLGSVSNVLRHQLITAGAGLNPPARGQRRTGEQVTCLRAVDVALERLCIVQATDEHHPVAEFVERHEHLAQLHVGTLALGPPFIPVITTPGKQDGHACRCLAGLRRIKLGVAPDAPRFHPRQRHRCAQTAQHRAAGKLVMYSVHSKMAMVTINPHLCRGDRGFSGTAG